MLLTAVKANFRSSSGKNLISNNDYDKVFFHHENLKELGVKSIYKSYRNPILTIACNGKKIYRQFKQGSTFCLKKGEIGFPDRDWRYLGLKNENMTVEVKRSTLIEKAMFYINNPRHDFRISIVLCLIGLFPFFYDRIKELIILIEEHLV